VINKIPNFFQLDDAPDIYRGGQPTRPDDWACLQSIGIHQIIKLNEGNHSEPRMLQSPTWSLFLSPISTGEQIFTEPDLESLRDVVGFIEPFTFIHCTHGQDRTGLVVGLYRVLRQGWLKSKAYDEMLAHGFHPELLGLVKAWEDLAAPIS
jgi:hypothetical protein